LKSFNYIQIFKDTYELTGTADKTATRTNNNYSEDKKRKMFKHSQDIEWSMLFGQALGIDRHRQRQAQAYYGWASALIPSANTTVFAAAVTPAALLDALAPAFTFATSGAGDSRMVFAGNQALIELSKAFSNEAVYTVTNTMKVYGMDFQEFILPNGRVLMKSHPLCPSTGSISTAPSWSTLRP
jgi:hypothetical protein